VVKTVITSLATLSKSQKRPAFGSIFLLNNASYLRMRILLEPRNPNLPKILSRQTQDILNSNFRTAKADYFNANFMPLLQTLADDPSAKSSGGKAATKEKFTKFFDLLDEVAERHRMARVLEEDEEGRDTVVEEVVKLVVPSLQRFTQKNREKEFSKSESSNLTSIPSS
jgi:exocyst complex protein 7